MQFDSGESESHALRGAIDVAKLDAFRDAFVFIEPMASGTIDDRLDPRELRLTIPVVGNTISLFTSAAGTHSEACASFPYQNECRKTFSRSDISTSFATVIS
jgi:hypothetical protein